MFYTLQVTWMNVFALYAQTNATAIIKTYARSEENFWTDELLKIEVMQGTNVCA